MTASRDPLAPREPVSASAEAASPRGAGRTELVSSMRSGRFWLIVLLLALPWLNPYAGGPSTWVGPWLFSAICGVAAFAIGRPGAVHPGVSALLAGLAAWAIVRNGLTPETAALAAVCVLVWLVASVAARRGSDAALVRAIALAWLVAALVSTAAALLQYVGLADRFQPWVDVSSAGEAFANLRQRNQFASLTAIGMAAVLWFDATGRRRWLAFAAMAWLAIGNAATTSRTGLLELLLLGLATWRWTQSRPGGMRLWAVALAAYVVASVGLPALAHALGMPQNLLWLRVAGADPCASRMVLWSNVLRLIALRPWLGWGWGELDFAHYMTLYPGPRFCDILDNAHNLPLHLAVELGVPAALSVCAWVVWAVWRARPWSEVDPARQLAWSVVLVLAAHSMLEYPLWYGPFQIALGLCLGLLSPPSSAQVRRGASVAPLVGVVALAALGYAAWDYHRASQIYLPEEQRAPGWRHDPLARLGRVWLFRSQVRFAELTLTPLTRANAEWTHQRALALLHYSPEPRVIEKAIESAVLLGRDEEALGQLARFRAAFPEAYAEWSRSHRGVRER